MIYKRQSKRLMITCQKDVQAKMDTLIKKYTDDYLTLNLTKVTSKEVKQLLKPLKDQLHQTIRQIVNEVISSTPISFHTVTAPKELTFEDLQIKMFEKLADKINMTVEKTTIMNAILPNLSKSRVKKLLTLKKDLQKTKTQIQTYNQKDKSQPVGLQLLITNQ